MNEHIVVNIFMQVFCDNSISNNAQRGVFEKQIIRY